MADSVYAIVAKVFSMSENDINDESGPENIESWDSFNGLILVDELENHFKTGVSPPGHETVFAVHVCQCMGQCPWMAAKTPVVAHIKMKCGGRPSPADTRTRAGYRPEPKAAPHPGFQGLSPVGADSKTGIKTSPGIGGNTRVENYRL